MIDSYLHYLHRIKQKINIKSKYNSLKHNVQSYNILSKPTSGHINVRSVPLPWSDWLATRVRRHASAITPSSECPRPDRHALACAATTYEVTT